MLGLLIKTNSTSKPINIIEQYYDNDLLTVYFEDYGERDYEYLERKFINNNLYLFFGWKQGTNENPFPYLSRTYYHDIIMVRVNENLDLMNIDNNDFQSLIEEQDLEEMEMMDEMERMSFGEDEYVYDDFCVEDDVIEVCSDYDSEEDAIFNYFESVRFN